MVRFLKYIFFFGLFVGSFISNAQKYRIGDVYLDKDGKKEGIVFWVNPERTEGWMVSLKDISGSFEWGPYGESVPGLSPVGDARQALADLDGYENTRKIRDYLGVNGKYAAQQVDFEGGWYIPSAGQMRKLFSVCWLIDPILKLNGGSPLAGWAESRSLSYWTSTLKSDKDAYVIDNKWFKMKGEAKGERPGYGNAKNGIRAVKTFTIGEEAEPAFSYLWNTGAKTSEMMAQLVPGQNEYSLLVTDSTGFCKVKVQKSLWVASAQPVTFSDTICKGEVYHENGFNTAVSGKHQISVGGKGGCNLVLELNLTVADTFHNYKWDSFCRGSLYTKDNFTAYFAGTYTQRWKTVAGCDSLITLVLTENTSFDTTYYDTICAGNSYHKYGFHLPVVSGDTICNRNSLTPQGCDSLVHLWLTVNPLPEKVVEARICEGEVYEGYGFHLTSGGNYNTVIHSAAGCDTMLYLTLQVNPVSEKWLEDEACMGDSYVAAGICNIPIVEKDTLCTVKLVGEKGCDSMVYLSLHALPLPKKMVNANIGKDERYTGYGLDVNEAGDYEIKWPASQGCDTLVYVHIEIRPEYEKWVNTGICEGQEYTDYGFNRTLAGLDTMRIKGVTGMDTIVYLNLDVFPVYESTEEDTFCEGETYTRYDLNVLEGGEYPVQLRTIKGCDSLIHLRLTMLPVARVFIDTVVCRNESYTVMGNEISEAGEYTFNGTTQSGCDSIVSLHLRVDEYYEGQINAEVMDCRSHQYKFRIKGEALNTPLKEVTWNIQEDVSMKGEEAVYSFEDTGRYEVFATVVSGDHCRKDFHFLQEVPYYPEEMEIRADPMVVSPDISEVCFSTDSLKGMNYRWDFGDGNAGEGYYIRHNYQLTKETYFDVRLEVTNAEDCVTEAVFRLPAYPFPDFPNTFSPNGDGVNDIFMAGRHVRIIDRNGVKIYEGNEGWDGSYKGKQVPEDTYFYEVYYLTVKGEGVKKGFITVVR